MSNRFQSECDTIRETRSAMKALRLQIRDKQISLEDAQVVVAAAHIETTNSRSILKYAELDAQIDRDGRIEALPARAAIGAKTFTPKAGVGARGQIGARHVAEERAQLDASQDSI